MNGDPEERHRATAAGTALGLVGQGLRFAAWAALAIASLLLFGAGNAFADPSFVVTESAAGPGDSVHFSISDTSTRATYSVEVDGETVAGGSVAADSGVSGQFTMPDLGDTNMTATVEAQIRQSDETTTRERELQYLARALSSGATGPQLTQVETPAPAQQTAPAVVASPRPQQSRRHISRRPRAKRRATHQPRRAPERHVREWRPSEGRGSGRNRSRASSLHRSRQELVSRRKEKASGPNAASPTKRGKERPSIAKSENRAALGGGRSAGVDLPSRLTNLLTAAPAPPIFVLASKVAGSGNGGAPVAALIALPLLGLTAVSLAGGAVAVRRRPWQVEDAESGDADDLEYGRGESSPRLTLAPASAPPLDDPLTGLVLDHVDAETMVLPLREASTWFAPISLEAVDARAMLGTRSERKYVIDEETFALLMSELAGHYLILEIDDARVFPYDTVYFDTPTRLTYRQHVQGRRRRFKCRTRLYPVSDVCFFEVKLKGRRGETIKSRLELATEDHGSLTSPSFAFLERELHEAYGNSAPSPLAPTLRTFYRRMTLVGRTSPERFTFDFELTFATSGKKHWIKPGRILLETKADVGAANGNGGSRETDRMLRRLGVHQVGSCSKYCLGMALAHPELRDNRFRRLLRRHFDGHRSSV